jgi:hypothetical protein
LVVPKNSLLILQAAELELAASAFAEVLECCKRIHPEWLSGIDQQGEKYPLRDQASGSFQKQML